MTLWGNGDGLKRWGVEVLGHWGHLLKGIIGSKSPLSPFSGHTENNYTLSPIPALTHCLAPGSNYVTGKNSLNPFSHYKLIISGNFWQR